MTILTNATAIAIILLVQRKQIQFGWRPNS